MQTLEKKGHVIADFTRRRELIEKAVAKKVVAKKTSKKVVAKKAATPKGIEVEVANFKKSKGVARFEAGLLLLKRQRKVWMQAQDIPVVAKHLYEVHTKKATMLDKIAGSGEKDYGKRRLVSMLESTQALIKQYK